MLDLICFCAVRNVCLSPLLISHPRRGAITALQSCQPTPTCRLAPSGDFLDNFLLKYRHNVDDGRWLLCLCSVIYWTLLMVPIQFRCLSRPAEVRILRNSGLSFSHHKSLQCVMVSSDWLDSGFPKLAHMFLMRRLMTGERLPDPSSAVRQYPLPVHGLGTPASEHFNGFQNPTGNASPTFSRAADSEHRLLSGKRRFWVTHSNGGLFVFLLLCHYVWPILHSSRKWC